MIFSESSSKCTLIVAKLHTRGPCRITIPRLELEAVLDSVNLSRIIKQELELQECQCFFWTDSAIILHSLHADCKRFSLFPRNRLQRILSHSKVHDWGFVSTKITHLINLLEHDCLNFDLRMIYGFLGRNFCNWVLTNGLSYWKWNRLKKSIDVTIYMYRRTLKLPLARVLS